MTTFERWAVVDVERKEAERRAEIEQRKRQEREDELAYEAYAQHALGERLIADLEELAGRLRRYVAMLRERVDAMADPSEQTAAAEWLLWCQHYVAERDPSTKPIVFPSVTPPRDTALADFRKRLGFSCNYW